MAANNQDSRPDPDALLAKLAAEEVRAARGKLKIFFGASPGVGVTFSKGTMKLDAFDARAGARASDGLVRAR